MFSPALSSIAGGVFSTPAKSAGAQPALHAQKANPEFADVLLMQSLAHGTNLIGKNVIYSQAGTSKLGRGKVTGVTVDNGKIFLTVGGNKVPLNQVKGIDSSAS